MVTTINLVYLKTMGNIRHIEEIANELNIFIERQYFNQLYRFNNQDLKHLEQENLMHFKSIEWHVKVISIF